MATIDHHDDGAGFTELVDIHAGILRKVATTYCRDAEDRADLAQEIMAQLWQAWPRYDATRPFSTWMYRVALNVAISHVRGVYRGARHFIPLDDGHGQVADETVDHESNERLAMLDQLIAGLDGLNRALLLLYLDERSHREIADILGISESNVGTRIGRLKQRLRDQLA
ncbi:MAG: sigma-70 family RNA polymerase sigma factor [Pseudomonadota bacterium]|uniref:RNA polymerase sigma factor n=1 Tax=Sphingomonas sp. ERG5 TaxID=1381597 RepID=UPI00069245AC|nr:sigma-70 family RNA polymerase sigma factor [Sphingomonas sp. ERG5]